MARRYAGGYWETFWRDWNWVPTAISLAALAFALFTFAQSCAAAPIHKRAVKAAPPLLLVINTDLARAGAQYGPAFRWIACQQFNQALPVSSCPTATIPSYGSYRALRADVASGALKRGDTILFDQEDWGATPKREQAAPARYARMVGRLAQASGLRLIFTGVEHGEGPELAVYLAAAPYAYAVGVQTQRYESHPNEMRRYARHASRALHAVNKRLLVIGGLASDPGGSPVTAKVLVGEYKAMLPYVAGVWLNVAVWPLGPDCAPQGCPLVAAAFLQAVGADG